MLAHQGIDVDERDIFARPLDSNEVRALITRAGVDAFFSWRSPTARAAGLTPGTLDEARAIALIAGDPRLMRRPVIDTGDRLIFVTDRPAIAALGRQ